MARPLRLEYKGAIYHISARGNERKRIFFSEADYSKFKDYMTEAMEKYRCIFHCYVLMGNHFHLIIETPEANLSKVMHYISSSYTTYINIKKGRSGHLFQGRYKSILVDKDSYLVELSRYIHLNPVRAGTVERAEDYPYSSYNSYISRKEENIVATALLLGMLSKDKGEAKRSYRAYVESGIDERLKNPLEHVYGGMILGSEKFIKNTLRVIKEGYAYKSEVSHRRAIKRIVETDRILETICQYFKVPKEEVVMRHRSGIRNIAIYLMKKYTGATNHELGELFGGVSYSGVSKTYRRMTNKLETDSELRKKVEMINSQLSNVKG